MVMDDESLLRACATLTPLLGAETPAALLAALVELAPSGTAAADLWALAGAAQGPPQWLHRLAGDSRLDAGGDRLAAAGPRLIGDAARDPEIDADTGALYASSGAQALVVLPLVGRGQWLGVARLLWTAPQEFTAVQARSLAALLQPAALVLAQLLSTRDVQAVEQQQAARQRQALEAVLDHLPVGILVREAASGEFSLHNRAMTELAGHPLQGSGGEQPATADGLAALLARTAQPGGQRAQQELELVRPDGSRITVEVTAIPVHDEHGDVARTVILFQDITLRRQAEQAVFTNQELLRKLISNCPSAIWVKDTEGRYLLANPVLERLYGLSSDQLQGMKDTAFYPPELAQALRDNDLEVMRTGKQLTREEVYIQDGIRRTALSCKFPLINAAGEIYGVGGVSTDITDQRNAEQAREQALIQQRTIEAQQEALRELSTPLIPLATGVLVMPLIGLIDAERASQIVEALLNGIASQRAHTTILDITGVRVVDANVASGLVQAARAARLLGAQVFLTGIGPRVAQTLVELGAELEGVVTLATLQSGVAHALTERSDQRTSAASRGRI
jgi:PAS domain S-box-containing protein